MLGNFFGGFASIDVFVQDALDADAGTADTDVVGGEEGKVVLEVHGFFKGVATVGYFYYGDRGGTIL